MAAKTVLKKRKGVSTFKNGSKKGFKKSVCIFWNSFSIYKMRRMDFSFVIVNSKSFYVRKTRNTIRFIFRQESTTVLPFVRKPLKRKSKTLLLMLHLHFKEIVANCANSSERLEKEFRPCQDFSSREKECVEEEESVYARFIGVAFIGQLLGCSRCGQQR